jgi:hypothetical protein
MRATWDITFLSPHVSNHRPLPPENLASGYIPCSCPRISPLVGDRSWGILIPMDYEPVQLITLPLNIWIREPDVKEGKLSFALKVFIPSNFYLYSLALRLYHSTEIHYYECSLVGALATLELPSGYLQLCRSTYKEMCIYCPGQSVPSECWDSLLLWQDDDQRELI